MNSEKKLMLLGPYDEPVATIRYANASDLQNEMPKVMSCIDLPDGVYEVYLRPAREEVSGEEVDAAVAAFNIAVWGSANADCSPAWVRTGILAAMNPKPAEAASAQDVERAASIIRNWRGGNAGEDDARDTARLVLSLATADKLARRMGGRFVPHDATPATKKAAEEWPEKWCGDMTVGNMIANLRTISPETPIYSAYHISREGEPSLLRVKRPTISRERVDGLTIKSGDESVPYSTVVWSHPQEPDTAPPAADVAAMREALPHPNFVANLRDRAGMVRALKPDIDDGLKSWLEDAAQFLDGAAGYFEALAALTEGPSA